jgi:hypothetical protein
MKPYLLLFVFLLVTSVAMGQEPTPTSSADAGTSANVTDKEQYKNLPRSTAQPGLFAVTTSAGYVRPDASTRRKRFINSTVGPFALGRMVATAGISTWRNTPEEWGTKWEGFGRRVASNFAKNAIKQTTKFGLDEALRYDSHFYRSQNKSFGARVRNALISPVTARDRNGKRVIGIPNLVGTYTSSIVANEAWYPARYDWKDGVRTGTISLGFNAAYNLFREFVWKK